jgi:hypothetical protein
VLAYAGPLFLCDGALIWAGSGRGAVRGWQSLGNGFGVGVDPARWSTRLGPAGRAAALGAPEVVPVVHGETIDA